MNERLKEAVVHFSGGSDSTFAAAVMAETHDVVHLLTYNRISFIGAETYTEKNYRRLCAIYGADKFIRKVVDLNGLHKRICYENYFKNLRDNGIIIAAMSFSKLAMFWASAEYALRNGIRTVADGSVPYMELYPDQNPLVREELRKFFRGIGVDYVTPAFDRPVEIEALLYAKGITTRQTVRGTRDDLQVFYAEQVLLALYLKFHLTIFGVENYHAAVVKMYTKKLDWIRSQLTGGA